MAASDDPTEIGKHLKSVAAIRQTQAALFSAASDRYGKASPGKNRVNKITLADTDQLKQDVKDIAKCELRIKQIQQRIAGGDFIDTRDRQWQWWSTNGGRQRQQ